MLTVGVRRLVMAVKPDPIVQHVVVRADLINDLHWPVGAVMSQACHASVAAIATNLEDDQVKEYLTQLGTMHKVLAQTADQASLVKLSKQLHERDVVHHLWVEQPENLPVCLATKPVSRSTVVKPLRKLKLFQDPVAMQQSASSRADTTTTTATL
eukprot:m.18387 g.18387  ORF g.18387 m.18387 type:complete len:155 (-) comp10799_c0_seq2:297-761(-)